MSDSFLRSPAHLVHASKTTFNVLIFFNYDTLLARQNVSKVKNLIKSNKNLKKQ